MGEGETGETPPTELGDPGEPPAFPGDIGEPGESVELGPPPPPVVEATPGLRYWVMDEEETPPFPEGFDMDGLDRGWKDGVKAA